MTGRRRAVLFDLDGVLLDSGNAVTATLAAVATCATGHRLTPADLPADALTRPRADILALLGVTDPDTACDRWWDGALAAVLPPVFPGVLRGLAGLRAAGAGIGVVTLQDRHRLPWLLPARLMACLDVVVTRQDAKVKPAPDGLHMALAALDARPERTVFVGDSPVDMSAALNAGVTALGAGWGWHPPDALVRAGARQVLPVPTTIGTGLLHHIFRAPVRTTPIR